MATGIAVVRARVWVRMARRPMRLSMTAARVRIRWAGMTGPHDGVVLRVDVDRTRLALALMRGLAFAHRLGLLAIDAVEVA